MPAEFSYLSAHPLNRVMAAREQFTADELAEIVKTLASLLSEQERKTTLLEQELRSLKSSLML